ncbi:MotE family protein [Caldanaerobacter sp.]|uniref:MotE family protein n=1 Tax=Caldanaerobacter sp. TaxID=2930036 RepID=UPI003C783397
MQKEQVQEVKRPKVKLFIILAFILIVISTFLLVFFNVGGSQTFITKKLSSIPFLKGVVSPSVREDKDAIIGKLNEEIQRKEAIISENEQKIKEQEAQIESLKKEIEELKSENLLLKQQFESRQNSLKDIATYYQNMDPQRAAEILGNLSDQEIINVLITMNKDSASKILEALKPEKAAKITNILLKEATMVP